MVKDSVGIMEQGACSGTAAVPIHYYDVDRMQEKTIVNIIPLGSHQFPASEPPGNFFLESHLRHKI